jgi:hypothetical protein
MNASKEKILEALIPGCSLGATLYAEVKSDISEDTFKQELNKLRLDKFVQSRQYGTPGTSGARALYVLTADGTGYLTQTMHYLPDLIRTSLPARHAVAHELAVVDIVRIIRREMHQIPYQAIYYDDKACKKHKKYLQLNRWIPDLFIKIKNIRNTDYDSLSIVVEVDMGSRKLADVTQSVLGRDCQTIFLCGTTARIGTLREELSQKTSLHGMVYFSLLSDFCENPGGLFGNNFRNLGGQTVGLYPP